VGILAFKPECAKRHASSGPSSSFSKKLWMRGSLTDATMARAVCALFLPRWKNLSLYAGYSLYTTALRAE